MSWSIKGVNNLSKILAEKFSGRLYSTTNQVLGGIVPDEKLEEIAEVVTLTAADVNKKVKKSKIYSIHNAKMPLEGSAITNGRKAIRKMLEDRCTSELVYR